MMPLEKTWTERFDDIVRRLDTEPNYREIVLRRLVEVVRPPSSAALAGALEDRLHRGDLAVSYRVRSPETGAGLGEYSDVLEVPREVRDPTADVTFRVEPERDIEVVYRRPALAALKR
jgi:hypothetical protein